MGRLIEGQQILTLEHPRNAAVEQVVLPDGAVYMGAQLCAHSVRSIWLAPRGEDICTRVVVIGVNEHLPKELSQGSEIKPLGVVCTESAWLTLSEVVPPKEPEKPKAKGKAKAS